MSVGACSQKNVSSKVLEFCKERRFPVRFSRFTVIVPDFQRSNPQQGNYPNLELKKMAITLTVNRPAPDFVLPDQDGIHRSLSEFRGQWVLLFFYPKDDSHY